MAAYESRAEIYSRCSRSRSARTRSSACATAAWFVEAGRSDLVPQAMKLLELDEALCPGASDRRERSSALRLTRPIWLRSGSAAWTRSTRRSSRGKNPSSSKIHHPARVGEVLQDPDGGLWMRGRIVSHTGPGEVAETGADDVAVAGDRLPV